MKNFKKDTVVLQVAQPSSLQAEQAIIGALLGDPEVVHLELSSSLLAEHFYDPFCKAVYKKAMELMGVGISVDPVVLSSKLDGVIEMSAEEIYGALEQIYTSYPAVSNLQGWADVIIDKSVDRNLAHLGEGLTQMAHAQNLSRQEKIARANRQLMEVESTVATNTMVNTTDMLMQTIKEIEENTKAGGRITGVPTGLDDLDAATCGLGRGDLVIVGARPSMGKTAMALSMCRHICAKVSPQERKPVLFFSLEMGVTQIGLRWLSNIKGIPMAHLRSGQIDATDKLKMGEALDESEDVLFEVEDSGSITSSKIAAICRKKHAENPLGMIVIDYLQLIEDEGKGGANKSERVGDISRALKKLAKELGVPVIALSQLSRTLETRQDKRPIMSDLRESGAIEQDADIIMFIYRDEVYNANTTDPGVAEIIIAKQRNGGLSTVKLGFNKTTTSFHSL